MTQNPQTVQPSPQTQAQQPNSDIKLFAKSAKIYPRSVSGTFRSLKWLVMWVTLGLYYLAPFLRWDRGPNAPGQAILIDLPERRAYFFFIEIWPQEVYYIAAILVFAAIGLFFVTSLYGRVWCGYLCPQTVWTDLFVWVERVIQGERGARQRLDNSKWSFEKLWKLGATHLGWFFISFATAGAFVLYFNDAPTLLQGFLNREVSPNVLGFMAGLTFSTYLMAGFAREQVCIYMCPYARFQSGMFDPDTLIISYETERGEPRGRHKKGESFEGRGHCIDCSACVQVCPVGIDIRDGLQIECIACGLCVDACNDIMDKMGLPRGLVRYDTERGMLGHHQGDAAKVRFVRPRTIYYTIVLSLVAGLTLYGLMTRAPTELHVIHARNPLFVKLSDGSVNNGYDIKILNKTHDDRNFALTIDGIEGAMLEVRGTDGVSADALPVKADEVGHYHVFIKAPEQPENKKDIRFILKDNANGFTDDHTSMFISRGTGS